MAEKLNKKQLDSLCKELKNTDNYWTTKDKYVRKPGKIYKKKLAKKVGISLPTLNFYLNPSKRKEYMLVRATHKIKKKKLRYCMNCGKIINLLESKNKIYCNRKCKDLGTYKKKKIAAAIKKAQKELGTYKEVK